MTIFTLRPAAPDDAAAALALYRDCASQDNRPWNEDDPNGEMLQGHIGQTVLFLAECDGELAGAVTLAAQDREEEAGFFFSEAEKPGSLSRLCIAPKWRGKGLGKVLLKMSEKQAARMGYTALHLLCDMRNETAHRMYLKNGYAKVGEKVLDGSTVYAFEKARL